MFIQVLIMAHMACYESLSFIFVPPPSPTPYPLPKDLKILKVLWHNVRSHRLPMQCIQKTNIHCLEHKLFIFDQTQEFKKQP